MPIAIPALYRCMMVQAWMSRRRNTARCGRWSGRQTTTLRLELLEQRRLLNAGALDPTFGQRGLTALETDATARAVVVQADEKILVLDQTPSGYDLLRYLPNGTPDAAFG